MPRAEVGARAYTNLLQLAAGAFAIGLDDTTGERLLGSTALGSIPAPRLRLLDHLRAYPGLRPPARLLADSIRLPTRLVARALEDLAALGLVERNADVAGGGEHHWSLSEHARSLAQAAAPLLDVDRAAPAMGNVQNGAGEP